MVVFYSFSRRPKADSDGLKKRDSGLILHLQASDFWRSSRREWRSVADLLEKAARQPVLVAADCRNPGLALYCRCLHKISAGYRRPAGHRRDAGVAFTLSRSHARRLHRRRRVLRDLGLPDHGHHPARTGTGRFSVGFYNRRIRRIFPALIVVLCATLVLGWFWMLPPAFAQLGSDVFASAAFSGQYRAAAAVRLFRRRIRQKAAAASVVVRHRGAILSVLAVDVDAGCPPARQHSRRWRSLASRLLCSTWP